MNSRIHSYRNLWHSPVNSAKSEDDEQFATMVIPADKRVVYDPVKKAEVTFPPRQYFRIPAKDFELTPPPEWCRISSDGGANEPSAHAEEAAFLKQEEWSFAGWYEVPGVTDDTGKLVPGFTPTRYELLQLIKMYHTATMLTELELQFFNITDPVANRFRQFARRWLDTLDQVVGENWAKPAYDEVDKEWKTLWAIHLSYPRCDAVVVGDQCEMCGYSDAPGDCSGTDQGITLIADPSHPTVVQVNQRRVEESGKDAAEGSTHQAEDHTAIGEHAPKTGGGEVGMDLTRGDEWLPITSAGWRKVLEAAVKHGWKPVSTTAPQWTLEDGTPMCGHHYDTEEWDGGYTANMGQGVTEDDALEMAKALELAKQAGPDDSMWFKFVIQFLRGGAFNIW